MENRIFSGGHFELPNMASGVKIRFGSRRIRIQHVKNYLESLLNSFRVNVHKLFIRSLTTMILRWRPSWIFKIADEANLSTALNFMGSIIFIEIPKQNVKNCGWNDRLRHHSQSWRPFWIFVVRHFDRSFHSRSLKLITRVT